MIVTYTEKDGDYEVDVAAQPKDVKPVTPSGSGDTALNVTEKGVPTFYYQDQTGTAANNETVYVIKTDDDEFASYTGFKNVPTVKLHGEDDDDSVETAAVSYVSTADNGVEFVFVDASSASSVGDTTTGDIFYVTDNDYTTVGSGSDTYYELTGILNGKVGTIKSESETMVKTTLAEGKLYELKVDNDGYVTDATEQASGTAYVKAEVDTNEAKGGVLDTDGTDYTYDGSETVIVIDDDEVVGGSISSAKDGDTVYVKVVDKSGTAAEQIAIEVIYIIKAA